MCNAEMNETGSKVPHLEMRRRTSETCHHSHMSCGLEEQGPLSTLSFVAKETNNLHLPALRKHACKTLHLEVLWIEICASAQRELLFWEHYTYHLRGNFSMELDF